MKISESKMKSCPFCGGEARVQLVDSEGNWKDDTYFSRPYSGVGYVIVHDTSTAKETCPIATYEADKRLQGTWIYDTPEEAIKAWNRRWKASETRRSD